MALEILPLFMFLGLFLVGILVVLMIKTIKVRRLGQISQSVKKPIPDRYNVRFQYSSLSFLLFGGLGVFFLLPWTVLYIQSSKSSFLFYEFIFFVIVAVIGHVLLFKSGIYQKED